MSSLTAIDGFNLAPCPFCAGPPVMFVKGDSGEFRGFDQEEIAEVHIFCHECGAQGGFGQRVENDWSYDFANDAEELRELEIGAANAWNMRSGKHADLYTGSDNTWEHYYPEPLDGLT